MGIFGSEWFFGPWPDDWKQLNITILEFYPIVLSVLLFGDKMCNQCITLFTDNAALVERNYAASTTNTYVSALGYSHRLAAVHDPTKVFWVIEMLKGYGKLGLRLDTRLPITPPILCSIFTAMCTKAFFSFLRVGKITCCPRSPAVLQLDQVVRQLDNIGNIAGFKLTFTNFKHSYNQRAVSITLHKHSDVCPVQNTHA